MWVYIHVCACLLYCLSAANACMCADEFLVYRLIFAAKPIITVNMLCKIKVLRVAGKHS